ncbi:MAG: protein phosphatase 2C domain-containing protein [Chloroflexota bacterium]
MTTPWLLSLLYRLEIGSACDAGRKRRDRRNEDAIGVVMPTFIKRHPPLLVVADGMGGHIGGALASHLVVKTIKDHYLHSWKHKDYLRLLEECLHVAHQEIRSRASKHSQLTKMGSTVAVVIIDNNNLFMANIGDSRIYLVSEQSIQQLSYDHSYVGELLRNNVLSPAQARVHPQRSQLTMSISARRETIEPYMGQYKIGPKDIVVLCSDGLWGTISDAQIKAIVTDLPPQAAADKLVAMTNASQGPDNISVIIARQRSRGRKKGASDRDAALDDTHPGY